MESYRFLLHRHGAGGTTPLHLGVIMLAAVFVEILWRTLFARKGYDIKGAAGTLGVAAGNLVFGAVTATVLEVVFSAAWKVTPIHLPLKDWRTWVAGFLAVEFAYYWFHRLSHTTRWLWASHAVHHTPEEMTLLSAVRLGWTNLVSAGWVFYLPLVLMGFDPVLVFGILALDLQFQFFLHTEAIGRLGALEWVLNTPSHHRVHHGNAAPYLDKNYGGMVIFYDRLFGTFASEQPDAPLCYGLAHPLGTKNPFILALGEWVRLFKDLWRAPSATDAVRIAFGPP